MSKFEYKLNFSILNDNTYIMQYIEKFRTESSLISKYTESKAFVVWAMGLYLDSPDLEELADESLTDMGDDHGIDFLRFDEENGVLYIVQSYYTTKTVANAPAKKAADLNASSAWLVNGDINKFNVAIQQQVEECRNAIMDDKVQKVVLVYLHDCGESVEVNSEMQTAKSNMQSLLNGRNIEVVAFQMGNIALERLYQNQAANIIVTDEIECPFPVKYEESSDSWKSTILTVSGQWLREQYNKYLGDLFSANYRGYLGNSRQRINTGIRTTAERSPKNFWAYNNGITILTTQIEQKGSKTYLHGMSIINGAQTTGSLGAVPMAVDLSETKILARVIECSDPTTIGNIVKYNNTQNKITAWDSFSNDPVQKQLQDEFKKLGHEYGIKRGFNNRTCLMSVDTAIQPMLALSGKYKDANRSKANLFESRTLYTEAFEHRGARNVLFACCLNTCLQEIKAENKRTLENGNASDTARKTYNIMSVIKFKYYLISIIAVSLHKIFGNLTDSKRISFMPRQAKECDFKYNELVDKLKPMVEVLLTPVVATLGDDCYTKYDEADSVESVASQVEQYIAMVKTVSPEIDSLLNEIGSILCNG